MRGRLIWKFVEARISSVLPGLALCAAVAATALILQRLQERLFGQVWIEGLVMAILIGAALRSTWGPGPKFIPGVAFSGRRLLELSVALMGGAVNADILRHLGLPLVWTVLLLVTVAIAVSYLIGRLLGLPRRTATMIACGNSICGNSAIAAVAPVVRATREETASSIAFTAVVGVPLMLLLPVFGRFTHMEAKPFGVLAGLTVYAIPQLLPATAAYGQISTQIGLLVKLMRVLMLGPVSLLLALLNLISEKPAEAPEGGRRCRPSALRLSFLLPWFIAGFGLMAAAASLGWMSPQAGRLVAGAARILVLLAMSAMGLEISVQALVRSGPRIAVAGGLSLLFLFVLSLYTIRIFNIS